MCCSRGKGQSLYNTEIFAPDKALYSTISIDICLFFLKSSFGISEIILSNSENRIWFKSASSCGVWYITKI